MSVTRPRPHRWYAAGCDSAAQVNQEEHVARLESQERYLLAEQGARRPLSV